MPEQEIENPISKTKTTEMLLREEMITLNLQMRKVRLAQKLLYVCDDDIKEARELIKEFQEKSIQ
jgi:hypothetical protein